MSFSLILKKISILRQPHRFIFPCVKDLGSYTFFQPRKLSYFFLNFGSISASASYIHVLMKKECNLYHLNTPSSTPPTYYCNKHGAFIYVFKYDIVCLDLQWVWVYAWWKFNVCTTRRNLCSIIFKMYFSKKDSIETAAEYIYMYIYIYTEQ